MIEKEVRDDEPRVCGLAAYVAKTIETSAAPDVTICVVESNHDVDVLRAMAADVRGKGVAVVLISSWEVYAPDNADEVIYENSRLAPASDFGRLCLEAERIISAAAREAGLPCAILRPAITFGTDVGGEGESMFREVASGRWFGIRQIETRRSVVCALDVARVAVAVAGQEGVFNVSDGHNPTLTQIAAAMSANTGYSKRSIVLPLPVAKVLAKIADVIPYINSGWKSAALRAKRTSRVLDTSALAKILPEYKFFNTADVIARTDPDYPYQSK